MRSLLAYANNLIGTIAVPNRTRQEPLLERKAPQKALQNRGIKKAVTVWEYR
ncbi:hypothetical protein [Plesiomonas shigelloides]